MGELDATFRALADRRRRLALSCLREHHSVSLPDLAEFVAVEVWDSDLTSISGERVRDVYFSLYHKHVPVLEAANLVHYEQEEDLVALTDRTTDSLATARDSLDSMLSC